jgi:hypothetical protein
MHRNEQLLIQPLCRRLLTSSSRCIGGLPCSIPMCQQSMHTTTRCADHSLLMRCACGSTILVVASVMRVDQQQNLVYALQGILSDGRTLLMAVAPAASAGTKAAAVNAMADGIAAVLHPSGMVTKMLNDEDMLPWQAFHSMAYLVRTSVQCIVVSAYCGRLDALLFSKTDVHVLISALSFLVTGGAGGSLWCNSGAGPAYSQCAGAGMAGCRPGTAALLPGKQKLLGR